MRGEGRCVRYICERYCVSSRNEVSLEQEIRRVEGNFWGETHETDMRRLIEKRRDDGCHVKFLDLR